MSAVRYVNSKVIKSVTTMDLDLQGDDHGAQLECVCGWFEKLSDAQKIETFERLIDNVKQNTAIGTC